MSEEKKTVTSRDDADYITLEFEDDESIECEVLGIFECNEKEYMALAPNDGSDDLYFFEYVEISDEEFELHDILSDEEFSEAAKKYDSIIYES